MNDERLSCGIVVARQTDGGWLTLMLRAYHHWDFPKGIREDNEEPLDAAKREVKEETSVEDLSATAIPEVHSFSCTEVTGSRAAYPSQDEVSMMYTGTPLPPKVERVRTRTWTNFKSGG